MCAEWNGTIPHHTTNRVITGAVRITVDGKNLVALASVTEPSENVGNATPVNVLNLNHPQEQVVGAYQGGRFMMTLNETWMKTPYQELGFEGANKFIDIMNHEPFQVVFKTYRPDGSTSFMTAYGCRVEGAPKPQQAYDRNVTTRTIQVNVAYTHLEYN